MRRSQLANLITGVIIFTIFGLSGFAISSHAEKHPGVLALELNTIRDWWHTIIRP